MAWLLNYSLILEQILETVITMAKDEAKASDYSKGLLKSEELYKVCLYTFIYHILTFDFPFP